MKPNRIIYPCVKWLPLPEEVQEIIWKLNRRGYFNSNILNLQAFFDEKGMVILHVYWVCEGYIDNTRYIKFMRDNIEKVNKIKKRNWESFSTTRAIFGGDYQRFMKNDYKDYLVTLK